MAELHPYYAESWFTAEGARLKLRRLKRAGIPDMSDWRFVTVTVADRSITPQEAYLRGKDKMRRFFSEWREVIGKFRWCWKLEFHDEDGYPHWHIALEYRKKIPQEMFPDIEAWWGLGRVNVERIKGEDLDYLFKYIAKGVDDLPDWVASYKGRMRVFQACAGFFERREKRVVEKKQPQSCVVRTSLRTRMLWDEQKGIIIRKDSKGQKQMRIVKLHRTFSDLLLSAAQWAILRQVPLVAPGVINVDEYQYAVLVHEHKRASGLARISHSDISSFDAAA